MDAFGFWTQFDPTESLEGFSCAGAAFNENKTSELHNSEILK